MVRGVKRQIGLAGFPVFADLHQNRTHQPEARRLIGKDAHHPGPSTNLFVQSLDAIGGPHQPSVGGREREHGQPFGDSGLQPHAQPWGCFGIFLHRFGHKSRGLKLVQGIKDRPNVCCNLGALLLARHIGTRILLHMELTALPRHAAEHRPPRGLEAGNPLGRGHH